MKIKELLTIFLIIVGVFLVKCLTTTIDNFVADVNSNQILMMDMGYKNKSNNENPLDFLGKHVYPSYTPPNDDNSINTSKLNMYPYNISFEKSVKDYPNFSDGKFINDPSVIVDINVPESEKYQGKLTKSDIIKIGLKQPNFFKKPTLIRGRYYYDSNFSQEPIPIEFAINPDNFCKNNPTSYPCYEYLYSK